MLEGTKLGRYEIRGSLGAGGMGEVYRACDTTLRRDVAIKLLPEKMADDPERLARLKREARLLAALQHPNVATVHGFEEHEGRSFIVMELVEGELLADRIAGGALPLDQALKLAVEIARALEAAHQRGILHRDLKPENVKVLPSGQAKVLDFGLAKATAAERGDGPDPDQTTEVVMTGTGAVMGTPPYMSPEQVRGEVLDVRADIWAFGCLLYEMLAGRRAFAGKTSSETLVAILTKDPDWQALPPATPLPIRKILERTLSKDHDQRLHHVADARIELEDALSSGAAAVTSRDPVVNELQPASGKTARRTTRLVAQVATGILSISALAVAAWYLVGFQSTEVTDRSIAVLPFDTLGESEATAFTDGIHGDMLTRLSQVSDLRVVSRTSVMRYRDSELSLPAIARELEVAWVLGADVQEVGDQVQIHARLMNAERDQQVWAQSYRRELTAENLFQIQAEVTEQVVGELQAQLSPQEHRAVERAPTEDLGAYRLYVRGRASLEQRSADAMARAVDYFQQALERDDRYALAWAGLADAMVLMGWYGYPVPETGFGPMDAVQRALDIDPELGEAHAALGLLHAYRLEGAPAVRALERAIELQPSYVQAQGWLCFVYLLVGRPEEALVVADRTIGLQPPPETLAELAETYLANSDSQQALAMARRALRLQPEYGLARFLEGLALYQLHRYEEAVPVLRSGSVAFITPGHLATVALAELASGDELPARETLAEIEATGDAAFWVGLIQAALGETEAAYEAFGNVEQWSDWPTLPFRYYYPEVLGPLRQDARYQRLLGQVNQSWGLNPDGSFRMAEERMRSQLGSPAEGVVSRTTQTGPDRYTITASTTLESPAADVWALLRDWERFLDVGLPGMTSDFEWLIGGPDQVPATFQFTLAEALFKEEIYERSADEAAGRYRLKYRMLEPALGVLRYDATFELTEEAEARTRFSAIREIQLEPNGEPTALAGIIEDETRRLRSHFAPHRAPKNEGTD